MKEREWDLESLFDGINIFHTTGITLGLSEFWHEYLLEFFDCQIKLEFLPNT